MTAVAARLLAEFQSLPPAEQLLVRERVLSLTETMQTDALKRLIGASAGKELLAKLLAERATERLAERANGLNKSLSIHPRF